MLSFMHSHPVLKACDSFFTFLVNFKTNSFSLVSAHSVCNTLGNVMLCPGVDLQEMFFEHKELLYMIQWELLYNLLNLNWHTKGNLLWGYCSFYYRPKGCLCCRISPKSICQCWFWWSPEEVERVRGADWERLLPHSHEAGICGKCKVVHLWAILSNSSVHQLENAGQ